MQRIIAFHPMLPLILLSCLLHGTFSFQPGIKYTALYDSITNEWTIKEGHNGVSWVLLEENSEKTGWNVLEVVTNAAYDDYLQAYAAGFLEGAITQHLIWHSWRSFYETEQIAGKIIEFATKNDQWVREMVKNPTENQQYWTQVGLVLSQFDGLVDGYNRYAPTAERLSATNLLVYQLTWEIGDISAALNMSNKHFKHGGLPFFNDAHCSSIVKPSPDGQQLFASHVTWTGYENMLRIFKHYQTNFNDPSNKSPISSFSSFPGNLPSGDDWYITSSKLVVMETTNSVMNQSLYYSFISEQTVMYWIRVIVANRMATTGKEWVSYFSLYNSGTYNNQWMVVDYKLFNPGKPLKPNTLWVAEQIPGYVVGADQTSVVINNGYWASYNIPFYPFIYNISDYPTYKAKYGDAYSYTQCARAQIFRRDQGKVSSLDDLKRLMRYNEWQTDPLSLKDACRGISARCDLNSPWTSNSLNGYVAFGAIDAKVTDNNLVDRLETKAVSGPTWDAQPPFAWTQQWKNIPHYGQPAVFDFDFVNMVPSK